MYGIFVHLSSQPNLLVQRPLFEASGFKEDLCTVPRSINQIALTESSGMAWENGAAMHAPTVDCTRTSSINHELNRVQIKPTKNWIAKGDPMLKLSDKITRARRWSWYLAGVLLLAACDVQSPVAVPTTAPTPGIAESEVTATAPAVEGTQTITETAAPDAEATTERVMAPTFDPTQTQIAVQPVIEGFELSLIHI